MIWTGKLGKIELNITAAHARAVARDHSYAERVAALPEVKRQLNRLDVMVLRRELEAQGAPFDKNPIVNNVNLVVIASKAIAGEMYV